MNLKHSVTNLSPQNYDQLTHEVLFLALEPIQKNLWLCFSYLFPAAIILVLLTPSSVAQLSPSEGRILFQVQKLLEYPQALEGWNRWTNLCFFPSSHSLKIVCSNGHETGIQQLHCCKWDSNNINNDKVHHNPKTKCISTKI